MRQYIYLSKLSCLYPYLIFQLGRPFIDVLDHLYMLLKEKAAEDFDFDFFYINFALKTSAN
jgi:hypothetical protein